MEEQRAMLRSTKKKQSQSLYVFSIVLITMLVTHSTFSITLSQVTTNITSSGLGTVVGPATGNPTVTEITGGKRPNDGANLFHSFGEFSVGGGDIANFLNNRGLPTDNILSRVTGENPSNIFGTIQTTGFENTNLFLMNPKGIIFGPNASLNISGSFYATTANNIELTDGILFTAIPGQNDATLLTSAPPEAFGFLAGNPAAIRVQAGNNPLEVPVGKAISFIGGDITIEGRELRARGGQINLASVSEASLNTEVVAPTAGSGQKINHAERLGQIALKQGASLITSAMPGRPSLPFPNAPPPSPPVPEDGRGGPISIIGGRLSVNDAKIDTRSFGTPPSTPFGAPTVVTGRSGPISIEVTESFSLTNSTVSSDAFFSGGTAPITVIVSRTGTASLINSSITSNSNESSGDGATITFTSPTLSLQGSVISTDTDSQQESVSSANGGDIELNVNRLLLKESSDIRTISFGPNQDQSGNITVKGFDGVSPGEEISISAESPSQGNEGFGISSTSGSAGNAGDIEVSTRRLILVDGGQITSNNDGAGLPGKITVEVTEDLTMSGQNSEGERSAISSSARDSSGRGVAPEVAVTADGSIHITDGATIFAESSSTLIDSGGINITAGDSIFMNNGSITTQTNSSSGGNIKLKAVNTIHVINSEITSNVQEDLGTAGEISLDPQFIIVQNSRILSTAVFGEGGPIKIVADSAILIDTFSTLDASSQFGGNGTVDIRAPIQNLSETIAPLPEEISKLASLFAERCAGQKDGNFSSFVSTRNGSTASDPSSGWLSSPLWFQEQMATGISKANPMAIDSEISRMEFQDIVELSDWQLNLHEACSY